ncbi:unnamed protein product [Schistocephalus solidus]|uniref:Uncharacterized protein n=1 Tax=Schistocephalus solidus TaxID=70667 RepID=A0A3P7DMQ4_SCHSO|nr:unnamed protein product [Schistocephalus solidus]
MKIRRLREWLHIGERVMRNPRRRMRMRWKRRRELKRKQRR